MAKQQNPEWQIESAETEVAAKNKTIVNASLQNAVCGRKALVNFDA